MRARWYVGCAQNSGREGTNMWQYIIPAISAIVVALVESLVAPLDMKKMWELVSLVIWFL